MNMSLAAGVKAEVVVTNRIGKCGRTSFKGVLINICCVWGYYVEKGKNPWKISDSLVLLVFPYISP